MEKKVLGRTSTEGGTFPLSLQKDGFALFLFVPVTGEYGVIGLMEKYISFLGIEEVKMLPEGFLAIAKECGPFGFYTKQKVSGIRINGTDRMSLLEEHDGFYQIKDHRQAGKMLVEVRFL